MLYLLKTKGRLLFAAFQLLEKVRKVTPGARIIFAVEEKETSPRAPVYDVETAVFMIGGRSIPVVT